MKKKTNFWSLVRNTYKDFHVSNWLLAIGFFVFGSVYSLYLGYRIDLSSLITGVFIILFYLLGMEFLNLLFLDDGKIERSLRDRKSVV